MKRNFYLLMVLMVAFVAGTNAQNVLSESFEGTFPPSRWTLINAGTGNAWTQNTTATYSFAGNNSMAYLYSGTDAANAWAFTPPLALSNTRGYYVSFYVRSRSATFPERLRFTVGNAATVAAQTNILIDSSNITNTVFRKWTAYYTPTAAGNFNFAFNCYSLANEWNLYVDSVTIFEGQPIASCAGTPVGGTANTSSTTVCTSGNVALSVTGSSTAPGLTYQWQSSAAGANTFTNITNATNSSYIANVSANTDFRRLTICAGSGASAASTAVTISVASAPANDSFCNPIALTLNGPQLCGNTTCATSGYDPAFTPSTPNNTVWYIYTPAVTGPVQARFKRPAGATTGLLNGWLGIYTVSGTCPNFTFSEVPSSLGYNLTTSDSVSVTTPSLTAGTTYYFMIDGNSGAFGAYCIQLLPPPPPPACTSNISPANLATGVVYVPAVQLSWNAASGATGYDVYFGTSIATLTNLGTTAATTVDIINTSPNTTYYWYIAPRNSTPATGCETNVTSFTTGAAPAPPANDSCGAAIALTTNISVTGTTVSATQSATSETCSNATSTTSADVWYTIAARSNGTASVILTGLSASFDAVLAAYSGTCSARTLLTCTDLYGDGVSETLSLSGLIAGQTYLLRVYGYSGTSGSFTITATGPALPVTGINLAAVRTSKNVQLSWQTLTEVNNAGFELQRSADGSNFSSLLKVNSKANSGNSTTAISYTAEDIKPFSGAAYYRLKQTDKDGRISYSNIAFVKGQVVSNLTLSAIYPNPTRDVLKAVIQSPTSEIVTFVISDMAGKAVSRQVVSVNTGDNTVNLNVVNLPSGNYLLKAICSNGCETAIQKFTKQ